MKHFKKFLVSSTTCLLLLAFFLFPVKGEAMTAQTYIGWWFTLDSAPRVSANRTIQVEVGEKFNLGTYFLHQKTSYSGVTVKYGTDLKLSYTSSRPSIATVGKTSGAVTPKKTGTTKITAIYKNKKYVCTLKVTKKGSIGYSTTYKNLNKATNDLAKYKNTKITSKNAVSLLKKAVTYHNLLQRVKPDCTYGFLGSSNKLILPNSQGAETAFYHITDYIYSHNPQESFRIKKASGKAGSSITVQLAKAPTEQQIYFLQYGTQSSEKNIKLSPSKSASFIVEVTRMGYEGDDEENPDYWGFTSEHYYGTCSVKKGSTSAKITNLHTWDDQSVELKKDYEYRITLNDNQEFSFIAK